MFFLPFLLFPIHPHPVRKAPAGTPLHIRLTTTVGSYASEAGTPVSALLIAPITVDGQTVDAGRKPRIGNREEGRTRGAGHPP